MLSLLATNVRYGAGSAVNATAAMLALAFAANLVLPLVGAAPPPDDDFRLAYFFLIALVVAGLLAGLSSVLAEVRDRRAAALLALPLTRRQVGAARVVTPLVFVGLGLLAAEASMALVVGVIGASQEAWRYLFIAFFAGQFALIPQLLLMAEELQFVGERSRTVQLALRSAIVLLVAAAGLKVLSRYVAFAPGLARPLAVVGRIDPESLESNLVVLAVVAAMTAFNYSLFMGRRSIRVS